MITNFNWIDAILLLLVALGAWAGYRRGFVRSALDLARWIGSLVAGLYFYRPGAAWLGRVTDWTDVWRAPLAFLFVAALAGALIALAGAALAGRFGEDAHRHRANRLLGVLPGFASGVVTAAILAALLYSMPFSDGLAAAARASYFGQRFAGATDRLEAALVPIFEPALRETLMRRMVRPESDERVDLPFTVEDARPRPDLEAEMLALVNRERAANDLPPLAADPEIAVVARGHSADMFARGYFAHNTPEGKTPFDRMREGGVRFRAAGENLALAPTLSIAHDGLMNSPGHRANILGPQYGRLGISVLDGGRRGLMITQNFRN